jgi:hypothetical protein
MVNEQDNPAIFALTLQKNAGARRPHSPRLLPNHFIVTIHELRVTSVVIVTLNVASNGVKKRQVWRPTLANQTLSRTNTQIDFEICGDHSYTCCWLKIPSFYDLFHIGDRIRIHDHKFSTSNPGELNRYNNYLQAGQPGLPSLSLPPPPPIPSRERDFIFSTVFGLALRPTNLMQWVRGTLSPGLKRPCC